MVGDLFCVRYDGTGEVGVGCATVKLHSTPKVAKMTILCICYYALLMTFLFLLIKFLISI